jgi:adiponectin receptor
MAGWDLLWIKFALDNPYLRNGFRPMPNYSLSACFASVFSIHNETANIWTHAGAGLLFAAYWWTLVPRLTAMGGGELEFWTCFFIATILMLFASAVYHTCRCHSHEMFDRTLMLDLSGIASVIGAQCVVTVRYLMWCHPEAQSWLYLFVTVLIAFNMLIIPIIMRYNLTNFRTFAFCLYACTPMGVELAAAYMEGRPLISVLQTPTCQEQIIVYGLCTTALSIRGYKAPERWYPDGRFDLLGASHQIFHCVIAYAVYYFTSTYVELSLAGYFHERCKVV